MILTNQKGLHTWNPDHNKNAKLVKEVEEHQHKNRKSLFFRKSELGLGGMLSKVQAVKDATAHGVETLIGNGNERGIISSVLEKVFPAQDLYLKNNTCPVRNSADML